jgi:monofunctional biosynthetic peptidoglycan transglycosylase
MERREGIQGTWKALLSCVLAHKFLAVVVVVAGWIVLEVVTLPFRDVRRLKTANPGETAFMREHEQEAIAEGKHFKKSQQWIAFSKIPKDAINAVIVSEDGTFWSHSGFDWFEFRESVERNLREGKTARGASTITQQLVKNLYLSSSKNPLRKFKEWILTWYIERTLSKQRILELYLNVIEWGWGIYGIEAASQEYFGKSAALLSREESARLAAVIPNPRRYRVDKETRYLERRSQLILNRMAAQGL